MAIWDIDKRTLSGMAGNCSCITGISAIHGGQTAEERTWVY